MTWGPASLSAVVVPHEKKENNNERCDASCTPGSLGVRSGPRLCQPSQSQCKEEVEITKMTDKLCEAWARILPFLHPSGRGRQIQADPAKGSWLACSVFCETVSGTWYSPRTDLQHYFLSAALPEGTLCHSTEEESYYCQVTYRHHITSHHTSHITHHITHHTSHHTTYNTTQHCRLHTEMGI